MSEEKFPVGLRMEANGEEEEGRQFVQAIQTQLSVGITKYHVFTQELLVLEALKKTGTGAVPCGRTKWIRAELKCLHAQILALQDAQVPVLKKLGLAPKPSVVVVKVEAPEVKFQPPKDQDHIRTFTVAAQRRLSLKAEDFANESEEDAWIVKKCREGHTLDEMINILEKSKVSSKPGSSGGGFELELLGGIGHYISRIERLLDADTAAELEAVHPSKKLSQEEYLSGLGLVSHEVARRSQMEPKKIERRRRTTANPKYNFNGIVDRGHSNPKRPRRHEQEISEREAEASKKQKSIESCQNQPALICCNICGQKDCNISCDNCTSKFHSNCIKLTASRAPVPHRLEICPTCVRATNPHPVHRTMKQVSARHPSIMSPSSQNKCLKSKLRPKEENAISASPLIPSEQLKTNYLNKITVGPMGVVKNSSTLVPLNIPKVRSYSKFNCPSQIVTVTVVEVVPRDPEPETNGENANTRNSVLNCVSIDQSQSKSIVPTTAKRRGIQNIVWSKKRPKLARINGKRMKALEETNTVSSESGAGAKRDSESQTSLSQSTNGESKERNAQCVGVQQKEVVTNGHSMLANNSEEGQEDNSKSVPEGSSPLNSVTIPSSNNINKEIKNGSRGKTCTSVKAVPKSSFSVKKTILAMTAAAKSVMSNAGIKIPQPVATSTINIHNKEKLISADQSDVLLDSISAIVDQVARGVVFDEEGETVPVSDVRKSTAKTKRCYVNKKILITKSPTPKTIIPDKIKPGLPHGEDSDSIQTETEPTTPASTLPLLSPVESRGSGDGLPRMTLSMMSSELSSSSSSDHRSECEESDVLLSLSNSPTSCFNESEGVEENTGAVNSLRPAGMEDIFRLRESVIDLKNQLSDQRTIKTKLLSDEQGLKHRIRKMHDFIECLKITFPEMVIPPDIFGPPESSVNLPSP